MIYATYHPIHNHRFEKHHWALTNKILTGHGYKVRASHTMQNVALEKVRLYTVWWPQPPGPSDMNSWETR